jgi:hypothetical protein
MGHLHPHIQGGPPPVFPRSHGGPNGGPSSLTPFPNTQGGGGGGGIPNTQGGGGGGMFINCLSLSFLFLITGVGCEVGAIIGNLSAIAPAMTVEVA